jgi:hypothetical protein
MILKLSAKLCLFSMLLLIHSHLDAAAGDRHNDDGHVHKLHENSQHINEEILLKLNLEDGILTATIVNEEGNIIKDQEAEIFGLIVKNSKIEKFAFIRTADQSFKAEANFSNAELQLCIISVSLPDGVTRQLRFEFL